jgi:hypothetical protein
MNIKFHKIFVLTLVLLLGVVFGYKNANAQTNPICPINYICTPIPSQPNGCPLGYTCTVITGTSTKIISPRLSPASPMTRTVLYNPGSQINLGIFDIKSKNASSTLKNLKFDIITSGGKLANEVLSDIIIDNYSTTTTQLHMSVDMNKPLPIDSFVQVSIYGHIKSGVPDGTKLYLRLTPSNDSIIAFDSLNRQIPVEASSSIITGTITLASSTTPYVTDASSNIQTVDNGTLSPDSASFSFNFTINNISNKDVFISKNGRKSLGINITPGTSYTFSSTNSIPASLTGDSSELFVIPSGSYRKFTTTGVIKRNDGMIANRNISINKISLSEIGGVNEIYSITNGLEKLYTPTVLVEQVDNSNIKNGSFVSLLTGSVIDSMKLLFGIFK